MRHKVLFQTSARVFKLLPPVGAKMVDDIADKDSDVESKYSFAGSRQVDKIVRDQ